MIRLVTNGGRPVGGASEPTHSAVMDVDLERLRHEYALSDEDDLADFGRSVAMALLGRGARDATLRAWGVGLVGMTSRPAP